jgi:hypothetical protein
MWEDLTIALCTVGMLLGLTLVVSGLVGMVVEDRHWIPRAFR